MEVDQKKLEASITTTVIRLKGQVSVKSVVSSRSKSQEHMFYKLVRHGLLLHCNFEGGNCNRENK